jgi:hypothetical protein
MFFLIFRNSKYVSTTEAQSTQRIEKNTDENAISPCREVPAG